MSVFTIIVSYNGNQWIERCLSSVEESTLRPHVIVTDNASSDDTVKIIKEKFPEVELVESKKNLGFGQANNIGLKKALKEKADYVFLLNQDAWIEPETIEKLINVAENHPEYGILSPYHLNYGGTETERYFGEWVIGRYTPGLREDRENGNMKEVYESKFVHAACWLMPIDTVKKVGGFDPLFFHYGEDNDYVQRLQYRGLKTGIVPGALLYHEGANEGLGNPEKKLWFQVNQSLILFKSPGASGKGAVALFIKQFLKCQFSGNKVLAKVYRTNLKRIFGMIASRREQQREAAYLERV